MCCSLYVAQRQICRHGVQSIVTNWAGLRLNGQAGLWSEANLSQRTIGNLCVRDWYNLGDSAIRGRYLVSHVKVCDSSHSHVVIMNPTGRSGCVQSLFKRSLFVWVCLSRWAVTRGLAVTTDSIAASFAAASVRAILLCSCWSKWSIKVPILTCLRISYMCRYVSLWIFRSINARIRYNTRYSRTEVRQSMSDERSC